MTTSSTCRLLSPALPSELLAYVLKHQPGPTTLILCSSRSSFVASVLDEVHDASATGQSPDQTEDHAALDNNAEGELSTSKDIGEPPLTATSIPAGDSHLHLLTAPLHQLAVSRHIRTLYVPTVTHLRAYLSVCGVPGNRQRDSSLFFSSSSEIPVAPQTTDSQQASAAVDQVQQNTSGTLMVYGFLDVHRDTSEWSGQGLSQSISTMIEAAHQLRLLDVVLIEPAQRNQPQSGIDNDDDRGHDHDWLHEHKSDDEQGWEAASPRKGPTSIHANGSREPAARITLEEVLMGHIPLLTGGGTGALRKLGLDGDEPGWAGRTVEVGRVLRRWMCFQQGEWG